MSWHSKYYEYGFNFKEISELLAENSVTLGVRYSPDPLTGYPDWAYELAPASSFTIEQTRVLLLGCNPFDDVYFEHSSQKDLGIAEHLLWDAIDNGKLISFKNSNGLDALKQGDVRGWCESIGRSWCIPMPEKPTFKSTIATCVDAGEDAVFERLQQSERENAGLLADKAKLSESLTKAQETVTLQKQQLKDATDRLAASMRQNATFQTEFDNLKADSLEGKTKSTLLRLLGGMAMIGAEIDIHASRISGLGQTVGDLALKGVVVDDETLSKRLKEAAALIAKPSK